MKTLTLLAKGVKQSITGWFGTCFIFPYIGSFIIPTDEVIFFRWVGQPQTRLCRLTFEGGGAARLHGGQSAGRCVEGNLDDISMRKSGKIMARYVKV